MAVLLGAVLVVTGPTVIAPLARRLGLAKAESQGILFPGGRFWVRRMAKFLMAEGFPVMIVDNSRHNVLAAHLQGVPATDASVFSEPVLEQVELGGLGRLLAMTSNDDTHSLASVHFARLFGRDQVYQLAPEEPVLPAEGAEYLRGHTLFGEAITHSLLTQRFLGDWVLKKTRLSETFDYAAFQARHQGAALPLFLVGRDGSSAVLTGETKLFGPGIAKTDRDGSSAVLTGETKVSPLPGQGLISLVKPAPEGEAD